MDFSGTLAVEKPLDEVYSFLSDPIRLALIAPDREGDVEAVEGEAKFVVKSGVSFIRGKFNVKLGIGENKEREYVELKGAGSGRGSSMDLVIKCGLRPNGPSSDISWAANINIRGTLATVGSRLIQSAARKYIDRTIEALRDGIINLPHQP